VKIHPISNLGNVRLVSVIHCPKSNNQIIVSEKNDIETFLEVPVLGYSTCTVGRKHRLSKCSQLPVVFDWSYLIRKRDEQDHFINHGCKSLLIHKRFAVASQRQSSKQWTPSAGGKGFMILSN